MLKVVSDYRQSGISWDHNGKSKISQIFIARSEYRIDSIQFAYVEQDGSVVLSERIGKVEGFENLKTITFNYPSEYITSVSGCYETYYHGMRYLSSITFHTNKGKYGPYMPFNEGGDPDCDYGPFLADPEEYSTQVNEFDYEVGGEFYGFFGTYWRYGGIETIGFYMKPLQVADRSGSSDQAIVRWSAY
ncbi:hypothetical protein OROMI_030618 [Orobanche minor]